MNRDSELIYDNQRFIIDAPVLTEPRAWVISKINRLAANGLSHFTLAQDKFDQNKDYIEIDSSTGNVIGMWADYYSVKVEPTDIDNATVSAPIISTIRSEVTYSGTKAEIRIGGSYKKFSVDFYDIDTPTSFESGKWTYVIDGVDVSSMILTKTSADSTDVLANQIKVKFDGSEDYLGKILTVGYTSTSGITSSVDVELKA